MYVCPPTSTLIWLCSAVCYSNFQIKSKSQTQDVSADSLVQLTSLIYVEKFEFKNSAFMEDKQYKQME